MLIKGGTVFDGTGAAATRSDVRIEKGVIQELGNLEPRGDELVINAEGTYVTPGFVDILNHSDAYVTLFSNPVQESLLQQGITTILMGNEGSSLAPLVDGTFVNSVQKWGDISTLSVNWLSVSEYLQELKRHAFGINLATLAGHSTVRRGLIGDESRKLSQDELRQMEYMLKTALREGAFGISTGFGFTHARDTSPEEEELLMHIAANEQALYATHLRNEDKYFFSTLEKALALARKLPGVNMELSHLKVTGKENWGQFEDALALLSDAALSNVHFDVYPYRTTASVFYQFLPVWVSEGGKESILKNLRTQETRAQIITEMQQDRHDYANMVVAMGSASMPYFGKAFGEIARNQNKSPEDAALDALLASENRLIVFTEVMAEENVRAALAHPSGLVTSAGVGRSMQEAASGQFAHPRYFGAMPRFLGNYVRDEKLLSWEEAIRKITWGPAHKIGLHKRGKITQGFAADVVVFDPQTIQEKATFSNPYQYPTGIKYVIVNGEIAVDRGEFVGAKNGEVLIRS
ncbi:MAG: amidohydrolase family protein [Candidatus Spechtbacterales bacterium]